MISLWPVKNKLNQTIINPKARTEPAASTVELQVSSSSPNRQASERTRSIKIRVTNKVF